MYHAEGLRISDDEIRLTVPLTEGLNTINRWHKSPYGYKYHNRYKNGQNAAVVACIRQIFGHRIPRPWGEFYELRAVRCSDTHKYLDSTNVRGGLKETEDCIVRTGLIQDDSPKYVRWSGDPEQRTKNNWGDLDGPATYVWIVRVR